RHATLSYNNLPTAKRWKFTHPAQGEYTVPVQGRVHSNNADLIEPALLAGLGLALQPEFIVWDALQKGTLESVLDDWRFAGININLVTPPGILRPARVTALLDFLGARLASAPWAQDTRSP